MESFFRFPVFIIASYVAFGAVIYFVLRSRKIEKLFIRVFTVGLIVIVGGMIFAKVGQNSGWPWWIYYPIPMLFTVLLPPVYFKMHGRAFIEYLVLSFLTAPLIHVLFSFFVGWNDYMPFIPIPSVWDII